MYHLFEYFDLFGLNVQLRIANKPSFHSHVSLLLSVVFIISIFVYSYIFGIELFLRKNPKTLQSTSTSEHYDFINYTQESYFIAWRLEDYMGNEMYTEGIIYPLVQYYHYKIGDFELLPMLKCREFNLPFSIPEDINDYYCIPADGKEFGGSWDDNKIAYFSLEVYFCENGDNFGENAHCASKEQIIELFESNTPLYLSLYYPQLRFSPDDDNFPAHQVYTKKFINLNSELHRVDTIRIGKTIISDDKNFLFESPKNYTIWNTASFETYYYIMSNDKYGIPGINSMLYCLNFYMNKDYTYYRRWYMKFSEALALISSFVKITELVLKEIAVWFNNLLLFDKLTTIWFDINQTEMNIIKNKKSLQSTKTPKTPNKTNKSYIELLKDNYVKSSSLSKIENCNISVLKEKNHFTIKSIKPTVNLDTIYTNHSLFGFKFILFSSLKCNRRNKISQYLILSTKKLNSNRDYLYIIKYFREFSILKYILLDHTQLLCFDYFKKEMLHGEKIQSNGEIYREIREYFLRNNQSQNTINRKLFGLLHPKVKPIEV